MSRKTPRRFVYRRSSSPALGIIEAVCARAHFQTRPLPLARDSRRAFYAHALDRNRIPHEILVVLKYEGRAGGGVLEMIAPGLEPAGFPPAISE